MLAGRKAAAHDGSRRGALTCGPPTWPPGPHQPLAKPARSRGRFAMRALGFTRSGFTRSRRLGLVLAIAGALAIAGTATAGPGPSPHTGAGPAAYDVAP